MGEQEFLPDSSLCPERGAIERERRGLIHRAIDRLPKAQREVILLGFIGGLSQAEIASRIGAPLGTVEGRSHLALERLRSEHGHLFADLGPVTAPAP